MAAAPMPALVEHALSLITLAQIEPPEKAQQIRSSLEAWRLQSAEHDWAYHEAVRQSAGLEAVAPALRDQFDKPAKTNPISTRARMLSVAFLAIGVIALFASVLEWRDRQPLFKERLATGAGQIASLDLPDGGRIEVGARTIVDVTYYRNRRTVEFGGGEARFDVAPDLSRLFTVKTREGRIEVLGTIFEIGDRASAVSVTLERGKVRFAPDGNREQTIDMEPGQRLVMKDGIAQSLRSVSMRDMAPWRRGWLVFEDEPLSEALPQINAYRKDQIHADDPAVLQLRLTGSFRIAESENLLEVLPQILPVTVLEGAGGAQLVPRR